MEYKSSELKAGIFIMISLIIFIGFLVVIVGLDSWQDKDYYRTRFQYVGGVEKGSLVRYAGLEVGRVVDMYLPSDGSTGVEVRMEVVKGTPIRKDSQAYLTTIGLMGSFYLEITPGSTNEPALKSGDLITAKNVTAFAQMSANASDVTDNLTDLLVKVNEVLNEENRRHIGELITSLAYISGSSAKNMDSVISDLNSLTKNLNIAILAFTEVVSKNDSSITGSIEGFDKLMTQSSELTVQLSQMVKEMKYAVSNNTDTYSATLADLQRTISNLEIFSQSIKEQPWNLIRKTPQPERELE